MYLESYSDQYWSLARSSNSTDASYPSRPCTTTKPSGAGVIALGDGGAVCSTHLVILPIGTGADNATLKMKVLGWRVTKLGVGLPLWTPIYIEEYTCTLCATTGVANSDLAATIRFVDTIDCTTEPAFAGTPAAFYPTVQDWFRMSPGNDLIGFIKQPTFGFPLIELIFDRNSSATACNALYCRG